MKHIHVKKVPSDQKAVAKAWERFNCDVAFDNSKVSKTVLDSWTRSREFAVNAKINKAPKLSLQCPINDEHSVLRKAALPVIKDSRKILNDNKLFMLLASAEGTIIEREGNVQSLMVADTQDLIIGSNWAEKTIGTNAVGTALSLKRPVQIVAQEHYCEIVKVWGCAAVPIKDLRDGSILGVLDTTGPEHSFLSMNLGWVNSMASCIELRLNDDKNKEKYQLIESCMDILKRWVNDKVMVFDNDGFLVWKDMKISATDNSSKELEGLVIGQREQALSLEKINSNKLPPDLKANWLEAVVSKGKTIGHILIIPQKRYSKRPVQEPRNRPIRSNKNNSIIMGNSEKMSQLRNLVEKLAKHEGIVTITGETGTGKEVVAKEIHNMSNKIGSFVAINCGAIQKDLLASELFGYAEGSFSGAKRGGMMGKFEAAENGTILLDEFCELPTDMQVYLLRVLEEKEVVRIGESTPRSVTARILVATNKNLENEVESGGLREDLYYRVSATIVDLPALKDHKEDVPFLFNHFIKKVANENGEPSPEMDKPFLNALENYRWPGNVRELKNFSENCFLMKAGKILTLEDVPERMKAANTILGNKEIDGNAKTLKDIEKSTINEALELFGGNVSKAAAHLGIARSTFYKKLKRDVN